MTYEILVVDDAATVPDVSPLDPREDFSVAESANGYEPPKSRSNAGLT
jgi:hypothetical protein